MNHPALAEARESLPHDVVASAARSVLERARAGISASDAVPTLDDLAREVARLVWLVAQPSLVRVINATGVIIHTNLGRAPLSTAAVQAVARSSAYSNLEYDLEAGERGSRYAHAAGILRHVTGCEDALVVNNNAAALYLVLTALAVGREVILSRGQAVEIGGGFRIPDVMRQSGAHLVEVGTTNRTYAADYAAVVTSDTAAIMRVHSSNFRVVGFTAAPELSELAALAHERGTLLFDDAGSGALIDPSRFGLASEPLVQESLRAGADLVMFSGDKLLGGPQCGIIAGREDLIARLRRHPLARALRVDKLTLAALEATLLHYLKGEAERTIPVWQMISAAPEELHKTAETWATRLLEAGIECRVVPGASAIGGGSLPGETLPTWLVRVLPWGPADDNRQQAGLLAARLRKRMEPVVARVEDGALLIDPRTVLPAQDEALLSALVASYQGD